MNRVEVYLDGIADTPVHAGTLEASFAGGRSLASSSFQYAASYLAHPGRYALSPDLPLTTGRLYTDESRAQFGAFVDAAPDEWGRKIVEANHARRRAADPSLSARLGPFELLVGVADHTRMGALRLCAGDPSVHPWLSDDHGVAALHDLERVIEVARRYDANEATDDDIAYLSDVATSPGGARPKANVIAADGTLAIAKLPHSKDGSIDVEAWEAIALTIAARAGLDVPRFDRIAAGARASVLITHRFDRTRDGQRVGYLSAASAMSIGEHDSRSVSYVDFADALAELSENPAADLRELYGRIALTVLINNVDDHWRNHAVLRGRTAWRLAPVFDLNPSRTRGVITSRPISADDDPRDRHLRHLVAIADAFALSHAEATAIVRGVGQQVARWRDVARELDLDIGQIEAMAPAFSEAQLAFALDVR
ncbi:type II toxin-antitoxin system HipA family toxin [Microcella sp.]|uniref:type II toxin-antitoxin system HipA family toxin n=1 Tax=Microcella sp. TaxID=1913979 RepID=UPI00299F5609|nr:type II toxin-antitoxin system HipA family toxin [Microcella sp.]MDX2025836.1 type II toxin-antitoxin system HipA family toxin [Microcella sp.]